MTPVLDMLYLTPNTWHLIYDTWRLTCYHSHDMLSHGTSTLDTWYCDTWHLYYMAYSWLSLLRGLDMIIILFPTSGTPELVYSWTSVSSVLMSPALLLLLTTQSYRRPAEYAWCRDDEDVSHDRASVRRILNGTKCHTEQSATPHVVGAISWICGGHL